MASLVMPAQPDEADAPEPQCAPSRSEILEQTRRSLTAAIVAIDASFYPVDGWLGDRQE
jgi:hypothetical protein